ncbi:hypothetical protein F441_15373 [Phytophthora nicotianae CJ01A1]|uniref:HAT C-terminal dimerisation domain-containing protein n=2 Tax=Phytophthora nicotianae TaxID=4792 RepID=W2G9U4_PHYNI|nr:hypothetical protein L915_15104 [Phytophthora nicotianae]ETL32443.1 hypothetical protein L916_14997 [Phytophthora nicotianae]ETP08699.1 hypothetical protein F441_15373 [Phytophthora nicotianae CJ01A1]
MATGNPTFQVLGRDRHDRLLNGQFQLFCDLVGTVLSTEFEYASQLKFLNLVHDIWTSCGKESIVGASVAFIDSSWRFRFIAALACVKNDGHNAASVAKVIAKRAQNKNCSMRLLNLCIGYGIGLKDNIQTVTGGNVIKKLRNLNNHFRSPKQREALKNIQAALSYPELEPLTDVDVRVANTCKLIRRSVVNYSAFEAYFKFTKDSSSVWSALSSQDWMLAVEMEAVTHCIANIALVEAQSENLVLSYMVVFRRLTENKLKSFKFDAMAIEAPRAKDANESSHRRVVRTLDQLLGSW